jgi:tRNA nucleotidyltransferase (CCA-adding enzyme)
VTNHLAHLQTLTDHAVRRLAKRLEPAKIQELVVVMTADQFGRPPRPQMVSEGILALGSRAGDLNVQSSAPQPILMGRHLKELGMEPSPDFGVILEAVFEAQLDGRVFTVADAFRWLAAAVRLPLPDAVRERLRGGNV